MKLTKIGSTYQVSYQDKDHNLVLVTSVALYNAAFFPKYLRWKVQEDKSFLLDLITQAESSPSKTTVEALIEMELLYREMVNGQAQKGSTPEKTKEVRSAKYSAETDIFSNGFNTDVMFKAETSDILDASLSSQPTIGDLVAENRCKNGQNKNKWRKKKKKTST